MNNQPAQFCLSVNDPEGFSLAFEKYWKLLYSVALKHSVTSGDAEDIVQEVFYKSLKKSRCFLSENQMKAWLVTCTFHACLNWQRHQHVKMVMEEHEWYVNKFGATENDYCLNRISHKEVERILREAIEELHASRKRVFILAYLEGVPNQAIATKLNIAVNTVKNHKATAFKIVRRQYLTRVK
jgi:RNA polymerase sigma-19 factor, ECF subfamily